MVDRVVEVEVPVEVPVIEERVVHVSVPVIRDHVIEVERERLVEVENPLQVELEDYAQVSNLVANALSITGSLLENRSLSLREEERLAASIARAAEAERATRVDSERADERVALLDHGGTAPVRVRREDGRLQLHTRGRSEEIVPALIAMLSDPEPDLVAAVEQKLHDLRRGMGGTDEEWEAFSQALPTRRSDRFKSVFRGGPAGSEEGGGRPRTRTERWQDWWNGRSGQLAQAGLPSVY